MSELSERAKRILANYPPHVVSREQAKIMKGLVKEVERSERKEEALRIFLENELSDCHHDVGRRIQLSRVYDWVLGVSQ